MMEWPTGKYGAILADPPWAFKTYTRDNAISARADDPYDAMSMDDIKALPVLNLAADNCVLFMWIVWPTLPEALEVIKAWGFTYKTCGFAWLKADPYRLFAFEPDVYMGLGYWTRANSEVCLLATRGKPKRKDAGVRQGIISPRREHSRKPDEIHERIERLVDGPYLELFARAPRNGWTVWGNETDKFKTEAA